MLLRVLSRGKAKPVNRTMYAQPISSWEMMQMKTRIAVPAIVPNAIILTVDNAAYK